MRLSDPTICQRLKIQIQLVGVIQDSTAEQATLHHQVLYRVQDHALDLNLPNTIGEALFMFTDNARGPAIVNIPRMITTGELSSIIPLEWITNYEKAFPKEQVDVHTTTSPTITHNSDRTVTTIFQRPGITKQTSLRGPSFRRINMISPVKVQTTHDQNDPPVHFYENGKPIYVSHINGHFIWDVDPSMCDSNSDCANQWSDTDDENYVRRQRNKKKKKKLLQAPYSFKGPEPPDDAEAAPLLRKKPMLRKTRLSRKCSKDYLYQPANTIPCIAILRSYEEEFLPLMTQTDEKKITRRPYVISQGITPHGHQATTPQEEVLNWPRDNAVAELRNWLTVQAFQLDQELNTYIDDRPHPPWKPGNFFREETSSSSLTKDKGIKKGSPTPRRSINTLTLGNQSPEEETTEVSEDTTETGEETDKWSEEDYEADLSAIAMVNPVEEEEEEVTFESDEPTTSASHTRTESFEVKTSNKWFTFDDIPPARYRERLNEFSAWIETTMANPNLSSRQVLADFINRMTCNLREWVNNLFEYERLQLINGTSSQFLGIIHQEFLGDISIIQKRNSQEYFEMKCCSLNRKNLERHYKRMAAKYYHLGRNNNPPLKQVFMASLPDELQPELQRMMMTLRKEVATTIIGEIYQLALAILDKLCEQQQMFKQLKKNSGKLKGSCSKSHLKIKCKESSTCESSIENEEDLESVLEEQEVKDGEIEYVFQDSDSEEDLPPKRLIFSISSVAPPIASITTKIPKGSNFSEEDLGSLGMKQIDGTPRPHFDLKVKTSVYDKPTEAVVLMDTGSCATVLRPHVLSKEMWAPISKRFTAANSEIFTINLISKKPIGLEIFACQTTWLRVLGSHLPDKDVLFGFDAFF
ncbi:polyprotein [Arachis hypogaea]|nr:polyprotein [Arachis hypogaea]